MIDIHDVHVSFKTKEGDVDVSFELQLDGTSECAAFVTQCIAQEVGRRVGVRARSDAESVRSLHGDVMYTEFAERRVIRGAATIARQTALNTYIDAIRNLQNADGLAGQPVDVLMQILCIPEDMRETITNVLSD